MLIHMKYLSNFLAREWVLALTLTLFTLVAYAFGWQPFKYFEMNSYDFRSKMREEIASTPVIIIEIDNKSIDKYGSLPWPRDRIGDAIKKLSSHGASIIGIDLPLSGKTQSHALKEIDSLIADLRKKMKSEKKRARVKSQSLINKLKKTKEKINLDKMLAQSVASASNVVLPMHFSFKESAPNKNVITFDTIMQNLYSGGMARHPFEADKVKGPITIVAKKSIAIGHGNRIADSEGKIRKEQLLIKYGGSFYPSFSLQLATIFKGKGIKAIKNLDKIRTMHGLKFDTMEIPSEDDFSMLISFNNKISFPTYSFHELLSDEIPPDLIKDKIVIIAITGQDRSIFSQSFGKEVISLPLVTANVIENIVNSNHIIRPKWAFPVEAGIIIYFGIFLAFISHRLSRRVSFVSLVTFFLTWNIFAVYLFVGYNYWLSMIYPSFLLLFGYPVISILRALVINQGKIDSESIESNRLLALSYQSQGMLDMAFDKLKKCPANNPTIKEHLYNLALDFERKRMLNKAIVTYEHLLDGGNFKDVKERIKQLKEAESRVVLGNSKSGEGELLIDGATTMPTLGRYEVIRELGHGAMGTVYLGKDPKINREVAIKTLRYDDIDESQLSDIKVRFFREAEAAGNLSHPNIVTIYDVGEDMGLAYMAMELLQGKELSVFCSEGKAIPIKKTLHVISSVAHALSYAHEKGVVHRDIKPSNIMMLENGNVKVTDFGIARVMDTSKTTTGIILGTPSYMSPEQISGKKVDGRSDLFSLGVVFYELLTTKRPFTGDSFAALMYNITNSTYTPANKVNPEIPKPLSDIVNKLLSKNLTKRYNCGKQVSQDLHKYINTLKD